MGLLERIDAARGGESRYSIDSWISNYLIPASQFQYGGVTYPIGVNTTWTPTRAVEITNTLPSYLAALRRCPPAFAAEMVRSLVLSQARFTFRNLPYAQRTPRRTFGTQALGLLERPWPNGTTGDLVGRMEWHAGVAGNSFVAYRPGRLQVLRPDWVAVVHGSDSEPDSAGFALDGHLLGYIYVNGGFGNEFGHEPQFLLPDEVAHWAPLPDPACPTVGMSWVTPAIRDMQADQMATEHKVKFFENGATPNLVVKGLPATSREKFDQAVEMMEAEHAGVANAYRTIYLAAGADATVVGSDLKQLDFKATQGAGETRVAFLSRVPAPLLGIAEGLAGSSLNAGNFGMARRMFADTWVFPTLQGLAAALAPLLKVPSDAELWFDTADIPLLREDARDAAEIQATNATTITTYVKEGFTPESAVAAVLGQNPALLQHSGMVSVQLQPPAPEAGAAQVLLTKAQAAQVFVDTGFDAATAIEAVDSGDLTALEPTDLVPKSLIEDPTKVDAEPGVPVFPADAPAQPAPRPGQPPAPPTQDGTGSA